MNLKNDTGMRIVGHSQSGKSSKWILNGAKQIFISLIKSLDSQNTNRNQLVYDYFMINNQLNNVKTKFYPK